MAEPIPLPQGCPESPPARTTVYTRTLHKACEVLGGIPQLAAKLKISVRVLERWLKGEEQPPMDIFLVCVDIALSPVAKRLEEGKK